MFPVALYLNACVTTSREVPAAVGSSPGLTLLTTCFYDLFRCTANPVKAFLQQAERTEGRTRMIDATLPIREYRLTTAEIIYHLPDHPDLLQSFVWQKLDCAPDFPELRRFLDFWSRNIDGKLHSVRVAQARFAGRPRYRHLKASFLLH